MIFYNVVSNFLFETNIMFILTSVFNPFIPFLSYWTMIMFLMEREWKTNYLTNQPTNYMELSTSWDAKGSWVSYEIPCILWNMKVHYCMHEHLSPVSIVSQISTVHATPSHLLKIHLNIILPSMLNLPSGLFHWGLPSKILNATPCLTYMPYVPPTSSLDWGWIGCINKHSCLCRVHSPTNAHLLI